MKATKLSCGSGILMVMAVEFVDEVLKCVHSNESYLSSMLSCGTVDFAVQVGTRFESVDP